MNHQIISNGIHEQHNSTFVVERLPAEMIKFSFEIRYFIRLSVYWFAEYKVLWTLAAEETKCSFRSLLSFFSTKTPDHLTVYLLNLVYALEPLDSRLDSG